MKMGSDRAYLAMGLLCMPRSWQVCGMRPGGGSLGLSLNIIGHGIQQMAEGWWKLLVLHVNISCDHRPRRYHVNRKMRCPSFPGAAGCPPHGRVADWIAEVGRVPPEALWGSADLQHLSGRQPEVFLLRPDGGRLGHSIPLSGSPVRRKGGKV